MKSTLRTRLVLLVVAALVPLLGLSAVNAWRNADAAVERALTDLRFAVSLAASSQQRVTETVHQVLTVISRVSDIADGQGVGCNRFLAELKRQLPGYANLGIVGADGYARCHGLGGNSAPYLGDRGYFRDAVSRRSFVVGEYIVGRLTGRPSITFALPVLDADGHLFFVAYAALDLTEMAKSIAAIQMPAGAALGIHDRQGTLLAGTAAIGQKAAGPVLQEAVRTLGTGTHEGLDGAGQPRLWAFMPSSPQADSAFFVAVSLDRSRVIGASQRQLGLELTVLALVAFLGGWIAWMMGARFIVNPTREILDATRQVEQGRLDVRLLVRAGNEGAEFSRIAAGFNRMAESLQKHHDALAAELASTHASEEKLRDAQRLGRIGYWEMDLDTRVMGWSDEVYDLLGLERTEFDGTYEGFLARVHPDDRAALEARHKTAIHGALPLDLEFRVITSAGAVRWMQQLDRVQGQGREVGQPARSRSGVIRDITEQHASQVHLRLLETCISRLNDMVMITEAEPLDEPGHRIVFVNDAFVRHTGYSREEALGRSPRFLQGPRTQRAELDRIRAKLRKWQPVRAELINYTKNGQAFWVELDMVPIADSKGGFTHWVAVERDITRRKNAEQALNDSEQRYAALFEAAPLPMWVFDMTSKQFLTVNPAAQQSYGYSAEEFRAMTVFDIRTEAESGRLHQELADALTVRRGRWAHRRKDGSVFPVNIVSQPVQYAGRDARFVVALDISTQVNAKKDVQDHLFTLQRAADAAQAITWHQTLEGAMQEVAEQARGVIGAHQSVVSLTMGKDWAQATHTRSLSEKYAAYRDLVQPTDGAGICGLVCETNRSLRITQAELQAHPHWRGSDAGEHLPMRGWLAIPLTGRNGKNIGLLQLSDKYEGEFTQQDEYVAMELAHLASTAIENARLLEQVSQLNAGLEQKVAERTASLARQEALFRALADQAPQVVWTANPDGAVTYANRAWFDLMGGTLEDWTGTHQWFAVVHPEDVRDVRANWLAANADQSPFAGIRRLLARDGSCHTMAYRAAPVLDEHGAVAFWVGIDADISEVKAIETALRLSNEELEAFSYSVSHDLRSPLNTIDGFSRLLAKQLTDETGGSGGKVQHYLTRIQTGVAQMGQLIEDLLSLAQVARTQLRNAPVDLSEMARSILQGLQARQPEREVSVHIESGLQAHGDERLLRVAMDNLLGNAWKFCAQQAQAEISVGQQADAAGWPIYFVRDNGAGFDMAYADKLFNPFQRLHAVSEFPGTGIGLATVSRVISRHGGRLWADAAPGCGATFFFTLPKVLHVL